MRILEHPVEICWRISQRMVRLDGTVRDIRARTREIGVRSDKKKVSMPGVPWAKPIMNMEAAKWNR